MCSQREIPKDTVIGPYKGRKVRPEEVKMENGTNMSYLWEVYGVFLRDICEKFINDWQFLRVPSCL